MARRLQWALRLGAGQSIGFESDRSHAIDQLDPESRSLDVCVVFQVRYIGS
jgi:hypothetical protein